MQKCTQKSHFYYLFSMVIKFANKIVYMRVDIKKGVGGPVSLMGMIRGSDFGQENDMSSFSAWSEGEDTREGVSRLREGEKWFHITSLPHFHFHEFL